MFTIYWIIHDNNTKDDNKTKESIRPTLNLHSFLSLSTTGEQVHHTTATFNKLDRVPKKIRFVLKKRVKKSLLVRKSADYDVLNDAFDLFRVYPYYCLYSGHFFFSNVAIPQIWADSPALYQKRGGWVGATNPSWGAFIEMSSAHIQIQMYNRTHTRHLFHQQFS